MNRRDGGGRNFGPPRRDDRQNSGSDLRDRDREQREPREPMTRRDMPKFAEDAGPVINK